MINATTISNPMEILTERSPSNGVQKNDSDKPEFGSVLDSKIKDQQEQTQLHEQQSAITDRQQEKLDADAHPVADIAKDDSKVEVKDEVKVEDKPQVKTESDAVSDEQPKADGTEAAQAASLHVVIEQQQTAVDIAALVESGESMIEPISVKPDTQSVVQATTVDTVATASVPLQAMVAEMDEVKDQDTENPFGLPVSNKNAQKASDANAVETDPNAKATFFGLKPTSSDLKTLALVNKSENGLNLKYGMDSLTGVSGKFKSVVQSFVETAKDSAAGKNPEAVLAETQVQPTLQIPRDVTFSPQVIKVITEGTVSNIGAVNADSSSDTSGSDDASEGSLKSDTQTSSVVMPVRSSFDNVIKSLEPTAKPQAPQAQSSDLQTKIIDQLVKEVRLRQFQGQSDIMVKLNPAELGQIRLHVTQTANGLATQINASSEQVRGLLQAHLPALTSALADAGLKMEQVSVTSEASFNSLMQDNASQTAYQQGNKQRHRNSGGSQNIAINPALINAAAGGLGMAGSAGYSWLA